MDEKFQYLDVSYFEKIFETTRRNHYQTLLIVEPEDLKHRPKLEKLKNEIINLIVTEKNGEYHNVSEIISDIIENTHPLMIGLEMQDKIHEIVGKNNTPIIFDDVGLMFSKELKIGDPIRIFKYSSRLRPIILFIPLEFNQERKTVTYGNIGDEDYTPDIDVSEIVVVELKTLGVDAL